MSARWFLLLSAIHLAFAVDPIVNLTYSSYQGTALGNGVSQWLGMRYAAPPVGNLRWAAPQDPHTNTTLQKANKHGLVCLGTPGNSNPNDAATNEDCLFLDVYAPSSATSSSRLPVYFFIQGGGFNSNSNANYNGSELIEASGHNIVVVNFNYRVGLYGFLASSELYGQASINNGLKDQRKALQWVQKYISQFGGDPNHVVIGGASAGAASVTLHLTMYGGRNDNLFHATIAESQSFGSVFTIAESQFAYDALVSRAGCSSDSDTLTCLRSISAPALQSINIGLAYPNATGPPLFMYNPTIEGDMLQDYTLAAFEKGNFIKLPAIYGDDTNEGTNFVPKSTSSYSDTNAFLRNQFPKLTDEQLEEIDALWPYNSSEATYPGAGAYWRQGSYAYGEIRYNCPGIYLSALYTGNPFDTIYTEALPLSTSSLLSSSRLSLRSYPPPASRSRRRRRSSRVSSPPSLSSSSHSTLAKRRISGLSPAPSFPQRSSPPPTFARRQSSDSSYPVYNYRFNIEDPSLMSSGTGVPHVMELSAIWGPNMTHSSSPASFSTPLNLWVIPVIRGYWISFIRSFDPNTHRQAGTPEWAAFENEAMGRLLFERAGEVNGVGVSGTKMETVPQAQRERCSWEWENGVDIGQ